jgi:hypothetical protein
VVECGGLENRCTCKRTEGSNPSLSASITFMGIHSDFKRWHQYLESSIGTGVGNTLQYIDSELILFVLREANKADIPVLPVHDELVFPQSHKYSIYIALIDAFWEVLGKAGQFGILQVKEKCLVSETVTVKAVELDLNTEAV